MNSGSSEIFPITSSQSLVQSRETVGTYPIYSWMIVNACISQNIQSLKNYQTTWGINLNSVYDEEGDPLLLVAIKHNKPISFDALMALGLNIENQSFADGATPLNFAAMVGADYFAEKLIAKGADVNTQTFDGYTPLLNALYFENYSLVEYFLTLPEVDVNIPSAFDIMPILGAYLDEQWDLIDKIIEHPQFDATFAYILLKEDRITEMLDYLEAHTLDIDYNLVSLYEEAKLFGLKFDLPGCFLPNSIDEHGAYCFSFEGYTNDRGIQMIAQSFGEFYNQVMNTSGIPNWAIEAFNSVHETIEFSKNTTNPNAYITKIVAGEPVLISSGWEGHSIAFVIHNDHLYRCNRGDESDGVHGIDEFLISKPWNLTANVIDFMLEGVGSSTHLQEDLIELLGLELIGQVENPTQIAGNCVWTSLETGVEALFITTYLELGLDSLSAHELAKQTFLLWEKYDLDTSINEIIMHPELLIQNEIYDDLLITILESHHNPNEQDDVARGVLILEQLHEPTVFASFDEKIGQYVMEYDPSSYKKISYMESYTPSYYDYFMSFIFSPEKKLTEYGLDVAKEYFDFLVACDDYQANHKNEIISFDEVIDHSLHQLFPSTYSDTPVTMVNNASMIPEWNSAPLMPMQLVMPHLSDEVVCL